MSPYFKKIFLISAIFTLISTSVAHLYAANYVPPSRSSSGQVSPLSPPTETVTETVIDNHITTPEEKLSRMEEVLNSLTGRLEILEHENRQLRATIDVLQKGKPDSAKQPLTAPASQNNQPSGLVTPQPLPLSPNEDPATFGTLQPQIEDMSVTPPPSLESVAPSTSTMEMTPDILPGSSLIQATPGQELPTVDAHLAGIPPQVDLTPKFKTAKEQYDYARSLVLQSKFTEAQPILTDFTQKYPKHDLLENALYWLGEIYFVQGQYNEAASRFAEGYKKFPKGKKSAETLLKLGMSLTAMGRSQDACLTFEQIDLTQKGLPANIIQKTQAEKQKAGCK